MTGRKGKKKESRDFAFTLREVKERKEREREKKEGNKKEERRKKE